MDEEIESPLDSLEALVEDEDDEALGDASTAGTANDGGKGKSRAGTGFNQS